jgi:hypothetical protein
MRMMCTRWDALSSMFAGYVVCTSSPDFKGGFFCLVVLMKRSLWIDGGIFTRFQDDTGIMGTGHDVDNERPAGATVCCPWAGTSWANEDVGEDDTVVEVGAALSSSVSLFTCFSRTAILTTYFSSGTRLSSVDGMLSAGLFTVRLVVVVDSAYLVGFETMMSLVEIHTIYG